MTEERSPGRGKAAGARTRTGKNANSENFTPLHDEGKGPLLDAALALAAQGKTVFPCRNTPDNEDTHKAPHVKGGFYAATTDAATIRRWWKQWPRALIGMPTGPASGIAVLDLDVRENKNGYAALPDWETRSPVIARTPSGGAHLYFNADEAPHCTSDEIALGVDTRGQGGYVIVPPSQDYSYLKGDVLSALPPWPDDLRPSKRTASATPGEDPQAHPFKVAAALAVIPNDDVGWDEWNRIGMATWRATDGDERGFEAFDSWSAKSSKYNARATAQRWRHFDRSPPERIGAGTLFYEAMAADPDWESKLDSRMELQLRRADSEASRAALFGAHTVDPASKTENIPLGNNELDNRVHAKPNSKQPRDQQPPARSNAEPLTTFKHGDVPAEPMRWLIRNRLPETGAGLLSGQWGMYKTFIELDASAHVMLGWNWTGERVHRQGGVLLLAPEGANSIPLRMAALVEHKIALHKGKLPFDPKRLPFEWTNSCPPLLGIGKADPLPALIATAAAAEERFQREFGLPLVLIWIDTMATAAGWEDEQDNADASRALSVMRNLSTASRTLVAGIDHYGKNIEAGSRGASAKEANSDFVLASIGDPRKVDGSVDNTRLVMRKLRDGPQGLTIPFDAKVVDMGMDRYNEPVTSCVINWDVQRQSRGKKKYSESVVLLGVVLNEVLAANGQMIGDAKMAKYVDVREAFLKAYKPEMKKNSRDERFRKAIQSHVSISVKVSDGIKYLVWLETPL